uniref:Uncharacterized protein n=1 Tax=Oryza rufipogon TaxID=4529 RepID=A0A0E0R5Q6_ORYRU
MLEDPPAISSSGLSQTALLRTPSMEEDEEEDGELLVEDMEMAGEDELLFLNDGAEDMMVNFVSSPGSVRVENEESELATRSAKHTRTSFSSSMALAPADG